MNHKKNIDDLFREHLKDFERKPDDAVWQAIESRLEKKKKHRPIFVWYKFAGVAALLLLLFSVGINMYKNNNSTLKEIVVKPTKNNINLKTDKTITLNSLEKNTVSNSEEQTNNTTKKLKTKSELINTQQNQFVVITKNDVNKHSLNQNTAKASNDIQSNNNYDNFALNNNQKIIENEIVFNSEKKEVKIPKKEDLFSTNNLALKEGSKKINIETLLNEEENADEKPTKTKKLSIGSAFSPIYYASLSKGSSVDENLANNATSNEFSSSYGVKVEYKIGEKWSIQTGVYNVDLNYTTNNVAATLFEPVAGTLSDISNVKSANNKLVILTPSNNNTSLASIQNNVNLDDSNKILTANGKLTQNVSYIEIPLELKYTIIDKKVGVQVLSGFSTLLLNKNEIVLDNSINSFLLGEATNVNKTSFSANLGVDIKYDISKKIYINLSPSFKYQINTFSDTDGGFKPYQIGINTGLNFRF